jgi:MraZ protein
MFPKYVGKLYLRLPLIENLLTKWYKVVKSGKFFDIFEFERLKFKSIPLHSLIGTYNCKVDAKGRMMIPAGMKKQLSPIIESGFVLRRSVFQKCLELYPMAEWQLLMQKMNKLNRFKKKNNDFIRRFSAGARMVEVDANGRLLIPKDLTVFASISKDVVISPSINIIEIWDKDLYEEAIDDAALDFADLAEEVMGQDEDDELS